jgi:hypothetical protein
MILFILKISESEQIDDAQLKGKNNRSFKRRGIGYDIKCLMTIWKGFADSLDR